MLLDKIHTKDFIDSDDDELVLVVELFRHGARRELIDY